MVLETITPARDREPEAGRVHASPVARSNNGSRSGVGPCRVRSVPAVLTRRRRAGAVRMWQSSSMGGGIRRAGYRSVTLAWWSPMCRRLRPVFSSIGERMDSPSWIAMTASGAIAM